MYKKYKLILADPAWTFKTYSDEGLSKSPQAHYRCSSLEEMKAIPVQDWAQDDSMLFMWATWPMLPEALDLMNAWGYKYSTGANWNKLTKNGKPQFGTGYRLRGSTEPFLIGTRGKPPIKSRSLIGRMDAALREHSRKPDLQYAYCEALSDGPYLEMFARQRWSGAGWDCWGDQTDKFDKQS